MVFVECLNDSPQFLLILLPINKRTGLNHIFDGNFAGIFFIQKLKKFLQFVFLLLADLQKGNVGLDYGNEIVSSLFYS